MSEISLDIKDDGIWLKVKTSDGRSGLLNINNVVNEMQPKGIIKSIFVDAIREIMEQKAIHG